MDAAALEAACLAVHAPPNAPDAALRRAEAEAALEAFKRSPEALDTALSLLQPATSPLVQFHCVATIRDVLLTRWVLLTREEKARPMDVMMQFLWQHYASIASFVAGPMLQTVALLMKRGWLERTDDERQAIVQQMGGMLRVNDGESALDAASRRLVAAKWILAFVTEFSSASRSSAMNQPVEFHITTRKALRKNGLKELLGFATALMEDLIASTTQCSTQNGTTLAAPPQQLELLETAFLLVVEMLNWDFTNPMGDLAWSLSAADSSADDNRSVITPDESWHDVLVRPDLIHAAFNTYAFFRNLKTKNGNLLHLARQFLIQLASLKGPIFSTNAEHAGFLSEIFRGTSALIHQPYLDMISPNDFVAFDIATREMTDLCQLLFRLVSNLGLQGFLKHAPPNAFSSLLEELSSLSCKLLQSAQEKIQRHLQQGTTDAIEDPWEFEGVDILLDSWVVLVNDPLLDGFASTPAITAQIAEVSAALSQYSFPVVEHYLQAQLGLCDVNAIAEQDEEEDVDDSSASSAYEQFELAAALARMNAGSVAALLGKLLTAVLGETQQVLAATQGDVMTPRLSQLFERLHFVLEYSGLFLSDEYTSERPCIPPRINAELVDRSNPNASEIINLLSLIMTQFLEFESARVSQNPESECVSPFVSEQLLTTITRLCATYVSPEPPSEDTVRPAVVEQVFGFQEGGRGGEFVNFLVQHCTLYLIHWPTQPVVMENLLEFLLLMSRTKALGCVVETPFWKSLVLANATAGSCVDQQQGDFLLQAVARIPSSLRGQLAEALCRAGMIGDDATSQQRYLHECTSALAERLQRLVQLPNFQSKESTNDVRVQEELKLLVELYTGVARSADTHSHAFVAAVTIPVLPVAVKIFNLFHGDSQIVYLILQFFCVLVETQIAYLPATEALQVFTSCHELIRSYAHFNLGLTTTLADAEEATCSDLLVLLQLLSHLVTKDILDYSDATASDRTSAEKLVAEVVFAGLRHVIPLMTEQLLQYPSLSKQYFTLVSYMIDVYAKHLADLDERLFEMLVQSLVVGMRHVQVEIARYSFQAIGELAGFHFLAQQQGEQGLEKHRCAQPELFVQLIRVILRMALFEDFQPVILDACASALYPLILIEQARYFAIANEVCAEQADPLIQRRVLAAFETLIAFLQPEDLVQGTATTRKYRNLFKTRLFTFVADVRGVVQHK